MSRGDINRGFFGPLLILGLMVKSLAARADDCTAGTQYCEDNELTTTNTTTTTNTNTNNITNNNITKNTTRKNSPNFASNLISLCGCNFLGKLGLYISL